VNVSDLHSAVRVHSGLQGVQMVVLFGSRASGRARRNSDWDFAVLTDPDNSATALRLAFSEVLHLPPDRVDVVDVRDCSALLAFSVASRGTLLYERQAGNFAVFQSLAFRRYADAQKFQRLIPEYLRRALARWQGEPMAPLERGVILRKLTSMSRYLDTLAEYREMPLEEFLVDFKSQLIVERLLYLVVEAAVDAISHLLVAADLPPPESYYDAFVQAGRARIVTAELALQLAPSAGLRNRLVHEYGEIDPQIVHKTIPLCLRHYREFVRQVSGTVHPPV
jgi:uncharacterized protein YutE (UPF0331/DUF86 family)/predicted nucleotidyltransferase